MIKTILIYNSGGGVGDSIQLLDLITSLKDKFPQSEFYYLGAHNNHFDGVLKDYNISINTLDLGLKYFGFRWWHLFFTKKKYYLKNNCKIDLIIDLQSKLRNTLILKRLPYSYFYSSTFNFMFCSTQNTYSKIKNKINTTLENLGKLINEEIPFREYKINFIKKEFFLEAEKILPKKNYVGFSLTQGNVYRRKSWDLNKFIYVAKEVVKNNDVPVFFIQKDHVEIIKKIKDEVKEAIFPEEMSSLNGPAFVTALSTRLKQAITIDNGIMHMIGLAKIPMIVLFGPTNSDKFAPNIEDIKILDSKKIYNTKDINQITVEDVVSYLK